MDRIVVNEWEEEEKKRHTQHTTVFYLPNTYEQVATSFSHCAPHILFISILVFQQYFFFRSVANIWRSLFVRIFDGFIDGECETINFQNDNIKITHWICVHKNDYFEMYT